VDPSGQIPCPDPAGHLRILEDFLRERREFAHKVRQYLLERRLPWNIISRLMRETGVSKAERALEWAEALIASRINHDAIEVVLSGLAESRFGVERCLHAVDGLGFPLPKVMKRRSGVGPAAGDFESLVRGVRILWPFLQRRGAA
jgi:hypothetical protein